MKILIDPVQIDIHMYIGIDMRFWQIDTYNIYEISVMSNYTNGCYYL